MMRLLPLLLSLLFLPSTADSQGPPPIRDNSFLIEEAYNQEPGVVQHVLLYDRNRAANPSSGLARCFPPAAPSVGEARVERA